jgi:hypothetical protein
MGIKKRSIKLYYKTNTIPRVPTAKGMFYKKTESA